MIRFYLRMRLRCRAWFLQAQAEHAAALIEDHTRRYKATVYELAKVRRALLMAEEPHTLIEERE